MVAISNLYYHCGKLPDRGKRNVCVGADFSSRLMGYNFPGAEPLSSRS